MKTFLSAVDITKRFHQVVANEAVSFDVRPGEIHCLLGENGAGKSTLAECIYGFYQPEEGQIFIEGKPVSIDSPADAIQLGIGMVHQHFVLVPSFTVLENIVIGTEAAGGILNLSAAESSILAICDRYGVDLDLSAKIWQLPVGQQQWVEILKALYARARLLIMDEPTAVLTPQESRRLFEIFRSMTDEGMSIVLISHKLNEVLQSDRVTVLRKGKNVGTVITSRTTRRDLINLMVGRDVELRVTRDDQDPGPTVLSISDLRALDDRGQEALRGIDLNVRKGEIVGIAGVAGNGQKELFETLIGVREATAGEVAVDGAAMTNRQPHEIGAHGVAYIPEDRLAEGLVPDFSIADNMVLGAQRDAPFAANGILDPTQITRAAKEAMDGFDIAAPSEKTIARTLSGGNAQKVIVAREFAQSTKVILANQPSRGLDVGVIDYMHQRLLEKRRAGFGILMASEELDELFMLADRIVVIFKGRIVGEFASEAADVEEIGLLMAGHGSEDHLTLSA
ncbi:MAG: ABC transporter ATP-binding protein [Geminicoccaceae bacterium]